MLVAISTAHVVSHLMVDGEVEKASKNHRRIWPGHPACLGI
jgi:hypothetical protein